PNLPPYLLLIALFASKFPFLFDYRMNTSLSGSLTDEGSFEVIERRDGSSENGDILFVEEEDPVKVEDEVLFDRIYDALSLNDASIGTKNAEDALNILQQRMSNMKSGQTLRNEDRPSLLAEMEKTMRDRVHFTIQHRRCKEQMKLAMDEVDCMAETMDAHFGENKNERKNEPSQNSVLRTITFSGRPNGRLGSCVFTDPYGYPFVHDIYKTSPAYLAGLRKGDRIVAVNGIPTFGATNDLITKILACTVKEMLVVDEECFNWHKKYNVDLPIDPELRKPIIKGALFSWPQHPSEVIATVMLIP
ncbi:hypothetical protein PFISCL1PPCAC_12173, partial [Pristionchus fissidentatus]